MLPDAPPQSKVVIACDPTPIRPDQMEDWVKDIVPKLYKSVEEIQELPDGYAWRLPSKPEILMLVAEDLNMERLCCPFVHYTLEITPNRGPFWLRMTGGEGVKEFLRISFESANLFDEQVARAAGFNVPTARDMDSMEATLQTIDSINERYARASASSEA